MAAVLIFTLEIKTTQLIFNGAPLQSLLIYYRPAMPFGKRKINFKGSF